MNTTRVWQFALAGLTSLGLTTATLAQPTINTIAGNGSLGYNGDGQQAVTASMNYPRGADVDAQGNIYIADDNNHRVRKIAPDGTISTFAGTGLIGFNGDGIPANQANVANPGAVHVAPDGSIYIADRGHHRVRRVDTNGIITTVAGTGTAGNNGDNIPAVTALLNSPTGVAVDLNGNIYISDDGNDRVRKIDLSGTITTVASGADFNTPYGMDVDAVGNVYVAIRSRNFVQRISPAGVPTLFAGTGNPGQGPDGIDATLSLLNQPQGVAVDPLGNVYIADQNNFAIRKVDTNGIITTFAGGIGQGFSGDGGPPASAQLRFPQDVVFAGGNLYIVDTSNQRLRLVDLNPIPTADAGPDQVVGTSSGTAPVTLDGSLSSDSNGTIVSYTWTDSITATVLATGNQATAEQPTINLGLGVYVINLTVVDDLGAVATDKVNITVRQRLPDGTLPPAGLVSWWKAEGDYTDTWGSNDGSAFGDVTFDTGIDGQALSFDGDNDGVPLGAPADLQLQDLTIAAWIQRASTTDVSLGGSPGDPGAVLAHGGGGYAFYLYGQGHPAGNGRIGFGNVGIDETLGSTITDTGWHHIAVARGSGEARFYVDGQLAQTNPYTTGFSSGPISIGGADALPSATWLGLLDEIQVYNRDLSDNEVLALYTAFTNLDVTIWAPDLTATYNQSLSVPISIDNAAGLVSAEVFVEYDNALLTLAGVSSAGALTDGWSVESNTEAGTGTLETVKIAVATDESNATGTATLVYVNFTVNNVRVPATSPLTLTHVLFNDGVPGNIPQNGSVTLVGNDGAISALPGQIAPSFSVGVTVTDLDQDLDDQNPDQFNVTVTVRDIGTNIVETEVLQVTETGNSTGVFTATMASIFSLTGNPGDGILQIQAGDQIEFLHIDLLDAAGNGPINRIALVDVLGGDDGTIAVTLATQPGDPIYILVDDEDLNDDPLNIETVQVTATNGGDTEIVTLTELDIDDDRFYGSVPTTSTASVAGQLTTAFGDGASVSYTDLFNTQGGAVTISATNQVIDPWGDADSNGQVQAFDAAQILLHVLFPHLDPLEILASNVDDKTVTFGITPFDASLVLQKRVGLINTFPVQDPTSENHPQPDPSSAPKLIPSTRSLSLVMGDGYVSVHADDRGALLAGDLTIEGITGRVEMSADLSTYLSASRQTDDGLRIVFAGAEAISGPGELLRVYGVGPTTAALVRATFNNGGITGTTSGLTSLATPNAFALHPNVPNPFNPETTIRFELPQAATVRLEVFDILGQKVRTLVSSSLQAGTHSAVWHGRNDAGIQVGNGIYLYRIETDGFTQMRRMLLLK